MRGAESRAPRPDRQTPRPAHQTEDFRMIFRSIATGIVIAGAALSAHSAPPAAKQNNRLHNDFAEAAGFASTPQGEYSFTAKSYTEADGSRAGYIFIDGNGAVFQYITCTGPEFANAVTMNQSTGIVTVNATVDPSNPNCFAFNLSGPALTLKFSGRPDGNQRLSESGAGTQQNFGEIVKFNFQSDTFSELFTGTTGLYTGAFTGTATSVHRTDRTKTK
jgi:hypothetical protein